MSTPTPLPQRLFRLARLALHLLRILTLLSIGYAGKTTQQQERLRQRLSRQLLAILHIKLESVALPAALPQRCLLASNHVSWLDIFVITAVLPATFVSRADVAHWPLMGRIATRAGTIYIERGSKSGARRANQGIARTLASGALVAICPEGTTSHGDRLLPFHAALFQPAVDAGAGILPVALRYSDANGRLCRDAAYVGEDSLLDSLWAIVSTRHITASVKFTPAIAAAGLARRELARAAEAAIAAALGVPAPVHAAGKRGHPPA